MTLDLSSVIPVEVLCLTCFDSSAFKDKLCLDCLSTGILTISILDLNGIVYEPLEVLI